MMPVLSCHPNKHMYIFNFIRHALFINWRNLYTLLQNFFDRVYLWVVKLVKDYLIIALYNVRVCLYISLFCLYKVYLVLLLGFVYWKNKYFINYSLHFTRYEVNVNYMIMIFRVNWSLHLIIDHNNQLK